MPVGSMPHPIARAGDLDVVVVVVAALEPLRSLTGKILLFFLLQQPSPLPKPMQ